MSSVNFLEKLLDGVSVEWKSLGDICSIKTGPNINKNIISNNPGIYPVINSGRDPLGYVNVFNTENDPIGIASRGSVGLVSWTPGKYFRGNLNYSCTVKEKNKLDVRYLYHYLLHADAEIQALATHQGIPALNASALKTLQVPLVPLEIQAEIVRILDAMTAHTAELTAELTARKKQYNFYREKLLSFTGSTVEWKKLSEVADIYDSLHQTPEYTDQGLSMIRVTDIKGGYIDLKNTLKVSEYIFSVFTKKYVPQKNDLVMSRVGSYGNVGIVPADNSVCMGQNTVVIHPKINNKYLFHILESNIGQSFIEKNVDGGNQKTLSLKSIKAIPIPIIGLEKQERIVAILDKFDALTASITEGLPREIELRQKQYAYYRDLLLSFPQAQAA